MLQESLIETDVSASSWREVISIAGELLVKNNYAKKEFTTEMIKSVEELGPYMILMPKLAFFHAKPGDYVNKVGLSLVVLKNSVYFEEFDNQEIKCAFAFCATDKESHLEMLKKFSVLLSNDNLIKLLLNNGDKSKILEIIEKELTNDI